MHVVSVLRKPRDVDAVLLPKKDLRRVDNEEVLVVRADVERLVKEHVRGHADVRVRLSERRFDRHHLAVVVVVVLFVRLKENHQTPNSRTFFVMMFEMFEMSFMSPGAVDRNC